MTTTANRVQVHDPGPPLPIIADDAGEARAVIWPGTGANLRTMHRISLRPGGRTIPLRHPGEAVYYLIDGTATATDPDVGSHDLRAGSMILVEAGTTYVLQAGPDGAELVGGPCPPDPTLYQHLTAEGGPA